jgi:hypothetical protein
MKCLDLAVKSFVQLACSHAEVKKCVCIMKDTLCKKNLNFIKDVHMMCANFIVIIITVSEKKYTALLLHCPSSSSSS